MMKIAYIRVSTDEQANEGYSVNYQISCARKLASERRLGNIKEFIDEGYSATNLNRPEMKKLIKLIEKNKVSDLIVYDLDRLSRDTIECMSFINLLKKHNVILHGINFNGVFESADERFMLGIKALLGQLESERTGERTKYGLKQSYIEGNYACSAIPYGYRQIKTKISENKYDIKLKLIDSEIKILKYAFNTYLNTQKSLEKICEEIHSLFNVSIKTSKLSSIFKNERYTGRFVFHGVELDGMVYGLIPLINRNEFDLVQHKLKTRAKSKKYDYLFENKVYCNKCKNPLSCKPAFGKNKKVYLYYLCGNPKCHCHKSQISETSLLKNNEKKIIDINNKHVLVSSNYKIKSINDISDSQIRFIIIRYMKPIYVELKKKRENT